MPDSPVSQSAGPPPNPLPRQEPTDPRRRALAEGVAYQARVAAAIVYLADVLKEIGAKDE